MSCEKNEKYPKIRWGQKIVLGVGALTLVHLTPVGGERVLAQLLAPVSAPERSELENRYGLRFRDNEREGYTFGSHHYRWALNFMDNWNGTRFPEYSRGALIQAAAPTVSYFVRAALGRPNVPNVRLGVYEDEASFKYAFAHELGHGIGDLVLLRNRTLLEEFTQIYQAEGPISHYAQTLCGTPEDERNEIKRRDESIAESIAFVLNPRTPEVVSCSERGPNPFDLAQYRRTRAFFERLLGIVS